RNPQKSLTRQSRNQQKLVLGNLISILIQHKLPGTSCLIAKFTWWDCFQPSPRLWLTGDLKYKTNFLFVKPLQ
ncbi:hypothetical protein JXI42_00690, partial [bacterium]|nr:hypothetical protein [bacterium]